MLRSSHNGKAGHFTSSKGQERPWNALKWKMHVQSVQNFCFFIVKYANFWRSRRRRCRGYLSSLVTIRKLLTFCTADTSKLRKRWLRSSNLEYCNKDSWYIPVPYLDSLNSKQSQMDRCNVLVKKFFHGRHCGSGFIVLKSSSVQSIKIVAAYSHSVLSFLFAN